MTTIKTQLHWNYSIQGQSDVRGCSACTLSKLQLTAHLIGCRKAPDGVQNLALSVPFSILCRASLMYYPSTGEMNQDPCLFGDGDSRGCTPHRVVVYVCGGSLSRAHDYQKYHATCSCLCRRRVDFATSGYIYLAFIIVTWKERDKTHLKYRSVFICEYTLPFSFIIQFCQRFDQLSFDIQQFRHLHQNN